MPQNVPGANRDPFSGPLGKYTPIARRMRRRGFSEDDIARTISYMQRSEEETGIDPIDPIARQFGQGYSTTDGQGGQDTPPTPGTKPSTSAEGAGVQRPPEPTRTGSPIAEQVAPAYGQGDFQFGGAQRTQNRGGARGQTGAPGTTGKSGSAQGSRAGQGRGSEGYRFGATEDPRTGGVRPNITPGPMGSGQVGQQGDRGYQPRGGAGSGPRGQMGREQSIPSIPGTNGGTEGGQTTPASTGGGGSAPQPGQQGVPADAGNQSAEATTSTDTSDDIKRQRDGVSPQAAQGAAGGPGTTPAATGTPAQPTAGTMQAQQAAAQGGQDQGGTNPVSAFMDRLQGGQQGGFLGISPDKLDDLQRFGLATMAADANPETHGLAALGKGGLSVMQANQQEQQRQREMALQRAQAGLGDSQLAQTKRAALQREAQPRLQGTVTGQDGTLYGYYADGSIQPMQTPQGQQIRGQQDRPYTRLEAAQAARDMAVEQVPPTGPDGQPIPGAEPVERVNWDKAENMMRRLGYDPGDMFRAGGQGGQAQPLPITSDGSLDTSALKEGQRYELTKQVKNYPAGTVIEYRGNGQFQPVGQQ